ncbi:hypothetical protein JHK85_045685 [Glycine max]|nr:hypothetical protein JHK85_045685 [Glycine max]
MREGNTGGGRTYGGTIGTNITFFFSRFPDAYVNEIYGSCFCILGRFGRDFELMIKELVVDLEILGTFKKALIDAFEAPNEKEEIEIQECLKSLDTLKEIPNKEETLE